MLEILNKVINGDLPFMMYLCLLFALMCLYSLCNSKSYLWKSLCLLAIGINLYSAKSYLGNDCSSEQNMVIYITLFAIVAIAYLLLKAIGWLIKS